jgi:error-prone DNA polymerase
MQAWDLAAGRRRGAVRGLRDKPLPLFEAADRGMVPLPEVIEPIVALKPLTEAREVVEDYTSMGLSLRRHPFAFLRQDLARRDIATCADVHAARDGTWLTVAGLVLVRQMPASASGVIFATIEDETGHANLIVWPSLFERQRRTVLSASAVACRGKVQREGEVIHVVASNLIDLTDLLRQVGQQDGNFRSASTRAEEARLNGAPDPRIPRTRDIPESDLPVGEGLNVKSRNFC